MGYLDETGLAYLWSKIKTYIGSHSIDPLTIYPVGAIYLSTNSTSPAQLFGGTWTQIEDTFLLTAGQIYTAGDTGGEASVALTVGNLAPHTHGEAQLTGSFRWGAARFGGTNSTSGIVGQTRSNTTTYFSTTNSSEVSNTVGFTVDATHEHDSVGNSTPHNNMPPYLVVYAWQRTA